MGHAEVVFTLMFHPALTLLPIAVRVYPRGKDSEQDFDKPQRKWRVPEAMFAVDTETSTDHTQRLKFGSYRFLVLGRCLKEGLFYADDLRRNELRILEAYVATHRADVVREGLSELLLLTRRDFLKEFFRDAYKARVLVVGFNLPFDLSRLARHSSPARKRFAGGFSLGLWSYIGKDGKEHLDPQRPRIGIKHIDNKRALKGFTDRAEADETDLIPEGSTTGEPEEDYIFRGHFLDLRTLAFALTNQGYSLEDACKDFGVEHGKAKTSTHGFVTSDYVDYNRSDVRATAELAVKLLEEYARHPIDLQPTKAYSPASIGKAYLRAMGIPGILERQPDFPKRYLGHAQSAFYGGRTSAHIRKVPVPVVYTDFLSMYPTVNSLLDLWRFVIAGEIKVIENCERDIIDFLQKLKAGPEILFQPQNWKHLTAFVRVIPDGDILPSRSRYSTSSNDWQVAINYLYGNSNDSSQALWFSLPDVAASVLLTKKLPNIVDVFRLEATGQLKTLTLTKLRGIVEVDPAKQDFFRAVIEERKKQSSRSDLPIEEKRRLDKALKVLANAASYGIYAEMHRLESDEKTQVTCYGIDPEPFFARVAHPDEAGKYFFSPIASLITGAARLMLALLEHSIVGAGGTYAMEDTDSMAIVATECGGAVPCAGTSINALSWQQVQEIATKFSSLNPYRRDVVPGSILKIEDDNFDPATGMQRQIYCLAISAKRYALFLLDTKGNPVLLRRNVNSKDNHWSEHGLGHLLNPTDPESEDREWIAQAWLSLIRGALKLPTTTSLGFESVPALGRVSVSSPAVMRPLSKLNQGKSYSDQVKPFNFLLTCHVKALGHPPGVNPERFHLISPYESDSRLWLKKMWIDQYSGKEYRITTSGPHGDRQTARVKTYGDVLREYEFHPESKCADIKGEPCDKQTVGLLQRRHIRIDQIKYIGKESNSLEEVEAGLIQSADNVYTEYVDPRRDEWQTKILPILQNMEPSAVMELSGKSRSVVFEWLGGRSRPHPKTQQVLVSILLKRRQ